MELSGYEGELLPCVSGAPLGCRRFARSPEAVTHVLSFINQNQFQEEYQ